MGGNPIIRDSNRWTALHHCAAGGCVCTTDVLLGHHLTRLMQAADQEGNTALHVAAKYGHVSVVELILSHGADITVQNNKKLTCLDVAIECGKEKVAEVLIKNDKYVKLLMLNSSICGFYWILGATLVKSSISTRGVLWIFLGRDVPLGL